MLSVESHKRILLAPVVMMEVELLVVLLYLLLYR